MLSVLRVRFFIERDGAYADRRRGPRERLARIAGNDSAKKFRKAGKVYRSVSELFVPEMQKRPCLHFSIELYSIAF
jgi:hypothetical protein